MNFLAHCVLAAPGSGWIAGAFLGDHLRGSAWQELPSELGNGVLLHRAIDTACDQHEAFLAAKRALPEGLRRFAPIALDVYFDHVLAREFSAFSKRPLELFTRDCYAALEEHWTHLPTTLRRYYTATAPQNLLSQYTDVATVGRVLGGISRRFRRANPLAEMLPVLSARDGILEDCFRRLMPDLMTMAKDRRVSLTNDLT